MRWHILVWSAVILFAGDTRAAQDAANPFDTGVDVRIGRRVFGQRCASCHGQDAKGNDETGAPDLTAGAMRNASTPEGVFRVIRNGVAGTAMLPINPQTSDQTVWQLVAYIDSLRSDSRDVDLPGDAAAGRAVYAGKGDCASCHMRGGQGGRQGPDLTGVRHRRDPDELRSALLDPDRDVAPRWWTVRVTRQDGSVVEGFRMGEDTFSLRIIDSEANLWAFGKSDVRGFERITTSTMPSYADTLTPGEVDDLIAYLFEQ